MLPNHAPLVVAEQFGMLEALHPGRIDLGIGRAPGTDQVTAAALRRSAEGLSADDFPDQLMRAARLLHRPVAGGPPVPRRSPRCPAAGTGPPCGCWARATTAPRWPGCSACRSPSPTTSAPAQHAARAGPVPRARSGPSEFLDQPVRDGGGRGALRGDRRAGPLAGRIRGAGLPAAALGPSRAGALARGGGRLPVQRAGARVRRGPPGLADHRRRPRPSAASSPNCSPRPSPTS